MAERKKSALERLEDRLEAEPELKAIHEASDDRLIERVLKGYRQILEREKREQAREEREEQRRQRLRRLTFGLFPR